MTDIERELVEEIIAEYHAKKRSLDEAVDILNRAGFTLNEIATIIEDIGREDRRNNKPCSSTNGHYLDGWYNALSPNPIA